MTASLNAYMAAGRLRLLIEDTQNVRENQPITLGVLDLIQELHGSRAVAQTLSLEGQLLYLVTLMLTGPQT